jgi:hypothetical protein
MSPAWIDMARVEITKALAGTDLGGLDFALCEEFTNPPDDLRRDGAATLGFCVRIDDGRVEVTDRPTDRADLRIVSDYEEALAVARDPDAPTAHQDMMEERIAEGRLTIVGDPSAVPDPLEGLDIHRLVASHTA